MIFSGKINIILMTLIFGCDYAGNVTYKGELAKPKAKIILKDILKYQILIIENKLIDKNNNGIQEYGDFGDFEQHSSTLKVPQYLYANRVNKYSFSNSDYLFIIIFPGENIIDSLKASNNNPREFAWFCMAWPTKSRQNMDGLLIDSKGCLYSIDRRIINFDINNILYFDFNIIWQNCKSEYW